MKSFFGLVILLAATTLRVHAGNHTTPTHAKLEVQTMSESCYGDSSGSAYAQSSVNNWHLAIYRNGALLNACTVASRDTFIHDLPMGCYTFIYNSGNGSPDTISKIISSPSKIISQCRVHYLNRPDEDAVSFINLSSGAVSFVWNFGDGEQSAEVSPVHVYTSFGTYIVTLTAINVNGCSPVSTYIVNIPEDRSVGYTGPANNESPISIVSDNGNARIANESSNSITQITVYSVTGQVIFSGSGDKNQFTYDAPGIYMTRIEYADGRQESKNVRLN